MAMHARVLAAVTGLCVTAVGFAATALKPLAIVNVSQTPGPTEKAKVVRLAYRDGSAFRKAWLYTYADGPVGRQNVYARYSFDEAVTWSTPVLLSRDGAGASTGGQSLTAMNGVSYVADNDKPSVFAPPVTSGPRVVITWNSAYCPEDPAAGTSGGYASSLQGVGDFDGDGTPERPYHCVWVATTSDPALVTWNVHQLTNGVRDAIGEVVSGSATGTAFALAWQEDPQGLRPGEAEGRGDGGSGANVSGGTNIWYTRAASLDGAALRANVVQLSDNNTAGTGQPGASRPNLQISGNTAVLAYEETSCPGSTAGKCVVYHSFAYSTPDTNAAGTIVSDVTKNSRRVRFVLQGASGAGTSPLRTVMLWRESPSLAPAAPADIIVRRGLADPAARPGSTGYLPSDILADAPQNMTQVAASGGNANAHRAVVRGSFVGLAYDLTPDMAGADPTQVATPTTNYNLHFTRSTADGSAGSWSAPTNLSRLESPLSTVVEPRLVPTPATVVNPLTGRPDDGDTQDPNVLYVAYATEASTLEGASGKVYVSRTTDQGVSFEPFMPVSSGSGESESQIRPSPDGNSALMLWMAEQSAGVPDSKDAMFAVVSPFTLPDLRVTATGGDFPAGSQYTVTVDVSNRGGVAHNVVVTGSVPAGMAPIGIGEPGACIVTAATFRCRFAELASGAQATVSVTLAAAAEGSYVVTAGASSEDPDADASDNVTIASLQASTVPIVVEPPVSPPPTGEVSDSGGGCTFARSDVPFDPVLLSMAGLALLMIGLPGRARRRSEIIRR